MLNSRALEGTHVFDEKNRLRRSDLVESVRKQRAGTPTDNDVNNILSSDWASLTDAVSEINGVTYRPQLGYVAEVLRELSLERLREQTPELVYRTFVMGESEDSLDVKTRFQEDMIGPVIRDSRLLVEQWKDGDIVSGIRPLSVAPEYFTAEYIHPSADERLASRIKELSKQWLRDVRTAKEEHGAVLLGIVQDVEESTRGNIEILYRLGFDLRRAFVTDPRLHYFNTDPAVEDAAKFTGDWLKEKNKLGRRSAITEVSESSRIPYERLVELAEEEELERGEAFYIAVAILENDDDVPNPFSWKYEHVVGVQRGYAQEEIHRIVRGRHQLDYSHFRAFDTNFPPLVRAVRRELLPRFYSPGTVDAWDENWGSKPVPSRFQNSF